MTVAFVLPGGANLGAVQVGILKVLRREGIHPDLLVGTSIGAVNAAYLGFNNGLEGLSGLEKIWLRTTRRLTFPVRADVMALGLVGRGRGLVPNSAPFKFLSPIFGLSKLEEANPKVAVVTTDCITGEVVLLTEGSALNAVIASSAIPGIFPPMYIGGRWLVDGSVAADVAVEQAEALGATDIYVLTTRPTTAGREPPKGAFAMLMRAAALMEDRTNNHTLAAVGSRQTVRVIPAPSIGADLLPYDFRHTSKLIGLGSAAAEAWVRQGALAG